MSTFEQSRGLFVQTHFTIIEIDLPVVEGECTISGLPGFGTPLSCDQPSNATKTYKFTQVGAPFDIPESGVLRLVKSISETPARLNTGKGLAGRGTASISFVDMENKDPNPDAPAVDSTVISQGSFLSKLAARNELTNKPIRIKNYRKEIDGSIDLENGAETRHYIIESMNSMKNNEWSIKCKDELSRVNLGDSVWPLPLDGELRASADDSQLTFDVDSTVTYLVGDTVRIGEELIKISAVSNIGTGSAQIQTASRGLPIVYTNTISRTVKESHEAGDEIYVCEVSDDERLDDLLERILIDVGVGASFIPKSEWIAEIDLWQPNARINTLWLESVSTDEVLESILTDYMIDMWFDPVAREIKIAAISQWQESTSSVVENSEINYQSITKQRVEELRSTRALVIYDKRFLATDDTVENFKRASLFKRVGLEVDALFGEPKTKRFEFSSLLNKDQADLLVNRWVNRYVNPFRYTWTTPERKLNFNTGDVVDLISSADSGFNGLPSSSSRCQIMSIKPNYKTDGRDYTVEGLSYEPVFDVGAEVIITGIVFDVNLYIQYAGAPSQPVELTFIIDANSGSTGNSIPSFKAGAFPAGSKIIIIMINGADLQARGGNGGNGGSYSDEGGEVIIEPPTNGTDGGVVYDAEGVDTDIYFSGPTPSVTYPVADGFIRAPSGGDGGFDASPSVGGNGGDGGNGRFVGTGGSFGVSDPGGNNGAAGDNGSEDGTSLGIDGSNNNAFGGTKGKGVIDSGATVTFFGDTPARYVNGGGDHV
ncbi:MAG TPA: hypothetical protein EYN54_01330 [Methylococcaceae bacterium]|nr:hypothetical protein [Methylococcaceae bacterium]